ncbi:MAG: tetratricopeptide repeat protein [Methanomassiliicoccales archaeon]|nr:MAG: tetratricopeptide repeat protein [Methanomassiliicoccales archaeon]
MENELNIMNSESRWEEKSNAVNKKNELDEPLIEAIDRMDDSTFKALVTKLVRSMGLEIIFSDIKDEKADVEVRIGEKIHDANYPFYIIRMKRKGVTISPEEVQDFVAERKNDKRGMIYISTSGFSENARRYAREFDVEIVDESALAAIVRKFDLLNDVMTYRDREILRKEKGRFLPSVDELENIIESGKKAYARGELVEALRLFTKACELKPNYDAAWYMRGVILSDQKRNEEALDAFMKALESNIENAKTWYSMGLTLYSLGRYNEEINCYNKAIELRRDFLSAWNNKGATLLHLERYEEANKSYDEVLKIDGNYKLAWNNKGIALKKLKRNEEAMECFTRAVKIDSNYIDAWLNKGIIFLREKRYRNAYHCFEAALKIYSGNVQALYNKGKTLEGVGQFSMALDCYENIITIDPEFRAAKRRKKKVSKSLEQNGDSPIGEEFFTLRPEEQDEYKVTPRMADKERILVEKKVTKPIQAEGEDISTGIPPTPEPEPSEEYPQEPEPKAALPPEEVAPLPVPYAVSSEEETLKELKEMKEELEEKERDLLQMEAWLRERYFTIENEHKELKSLRASFERTKKEIEDERISAHKMADELEKKAAMLSSAEEDINRAREKNMREQTQIEEERNELRSKAEAVVKEAHGSIEEREALKEKLKLLELRETEINTASNMLISERKNIEEERSILENEIGKITSAKDELKARENAINLREMELKSGFDEVIKRSQEMSTKEKELERVAYELKETQENLEKRAKTLKDRERSLEENLKIRAKELHIEPMEDIKEKPGEILPQRSKEVDELAHEKPQSFVVKTDTAPSPPVPVDREDEEIIEEEKITPQPEVQGPLPEFLTLPEEGLKEVLSSEEMEAIKGILVMYGLRRFDDALERIDEALQQGGNSKLLWNLKGNILRNKKHPLEALICYDNALKMNQNNDITLLNLMSLNCDMERYDDAYNWCKKVNALRPKDEKVILQKALLEARTGKIDEAISTVDDLLIENEQSDVVWSLKGLLLFNSNQDDKALECYERALKINPEQITALNNKGIILFHNGKFEEALDCFNKALKILPNQKIQINKEKIQEKLRGYKAPEGTPVEVEKIDSATELLGELGKMSEGAEEETPKESLKEIAEEIEVSMGKAAEEAESEEDSANLYMCPSCGMFVSPTATKCEKCGYNFEEEGEEAVEEIEKKGKLEEEEPGGKETSKEEAIAKLMMISGVGRSKAIALYDAGYTNYDILRNTPSEDIGKVKGIGKALAKNIKDQLKKGKFSRG